jgi:hypothetical protein
MNQICVVKALHVLQRNQLRDDRVYVEQLFKTLESEREEVVAPWHLLVVCALNTGEQFESRRELANERHDHQSFKVHPRCSSASFKYLLKCSISPALLQYPQGAARTLHPPSHHRFQRTMMRLLYLDRHLYTVPNHRALMVHRRLR